MSSAAHKFGEAGWRMSWRVDLRIGVCCCALSNAVVLGAVWYAGRYLPRADGEPTGRRTFVERMLGVDGVEYKGIAQSGYRYRRQQMSNVVFFPLYPLLALDLAMLTRARIDWTMVVVSNLCFATALVLLARYCRKRWPACPQRMPWFVVLSCALFPGGCFFHMAYTESCFLFLSLAAFLCLERAWTKPSASGYLSRSERATVFSLGSPLYAALLVGLATAARPTGVALLAPLAVRLWRKCPSLRSRLFGCALWLPLGSWGLLAYMMYQQYAFGNALAFAQAQESFHIRPLAPARQKILALATLEPLRAVYDGESPACWRRYDRRWALSWQFANPIFFVLAWTLIALGLWRRWLSAGEIWFSVLLLLIPYVTRGYEMGMGSMGRFVSVAFPIYLVLGRLLSGAPRWLAVAVLALQAVYLAIFSARFAAGYFVF